MHYFSLSIEQHIAHLVLNQPETLNTMNPAFWRELDEVRTQLHRGNSARVLVISSTGKHFSAGMSLDTFSGAIAMDDQSPEGRAAISGRLHTGNQHRHGGRCGHTATPAQTHPAGGGERTSL